MEGDLSWYSLHADQNGEIFFTLHINVGPQCTAHSLPGRYADNIHMQDDLCAYLELDRLINVNGLNALEKTREIVKSFGKGRMGVIALHEIHIKGCGEMKCITWSESKAWQGMEEWCNVEWTRKTREGK